MTDRDPEFQAWIDRARDVPIMEVAAMVGVAARPDGQPCPNCGGTDRFNINKKQNRAYCRHCMPEGVDGIGLYEKVVGVSFIESCTAILNQDPPQREQRAEPRPIDHERDQMRREVQKDREIAAAVQDKAERAKKANRAQEVFDSAKPIRGTWGDAYFKARGIILAREQADFLRFVPEHPFYHGVDENKKPITIGHWPAVVTLMRDAAGNAIGLHCTYLDHQKPVKAYIVPPGENDAINPRKMYGTAGLIWLSPPRPVMAIGEGVETTASWYQLGIGPDECGIAAAGSLGNMSGKALGTVPHPRFPKRTVPNGIPDPEAPGMPIPDGVRELILLGDADGDGLNVRAHLLTAARRHAAAGRTVSIHMSPLPEGEKKFDFNDVLMRGAA